MFVSDLFNLRETMRHKEVREKEEEKLVSLLPYTNGRDNQRNSQSVFLVVIYGNRR